MTRILLIGELNETMKSISEHLMSNFQVQICSENVRNVIDMIKIFRPALLVMNINTLNDEVVLIFNELNNENSFMPLVMISDKESEAGLNELSSNFDNKRIVLRPVYASDISRACNEILGRKELTDKYKEKTYRPTVLLVDDNPLVLRKVKTMLDDDYNIIIANDGEKGFAFAKNRKPDLILMDYEMPGMNGSEVFAKIKDDPEIANTPVIFLTSVSDKEHIMEVMKNHPNGYILKPPSNEKLIEAINEALK